MDTARRRTPLHTDARHRTIEGTSECSAYGGSPWREAYTIAEAAVASGLSRRTIEYALERGDLVARYPSTRPVILHSDLRAWLRSLPTNRPSAPRRDGVAG